MLCFYSVLTWRMIKQSDEELPSRLRIHVWGKQEVHPKTKPEATPTPNKGSAWPQAG